MGIASIVQFISAKLGFSVKRGVALQDERYFLWPTLEMVIGTFLEKRNAATFVQIGAYDGVDSDILHSWLERYPLSGVLVEPVPETFEKLLAQCGHRSGLKFENVAISPRGDSQPFYRLYPDYLERARHPVKSRPEPGQLSSFDPQHILKHVPYNGDWHDIIETLEIPCLSLSDLLAKHEIEALDLLLVDAEGADFPILMEHDWESCKPSIVIFEHIHIPRRDREELIGKLIKEGYRWAPSGLNTIAVHESVDLKSGPGDFPTSPL